MATFKNFSQYSKKHEEPKERGKKITLDEIDEILRELDGLMDRYSALLKLDNEKFLSKDTTKELDYIRDRALELIKEMNER